MKINCEIYFAGISPNVTKIFVLSKIGLNVNNVHTESITSPITTPLQNILTKSITNPYLDPALAGQSYQTNQKRLFKA